MARHYYQGSYKPMNPQKYVGDVSKIVYRSKWERDFFRYCDTHPSVLKWASEEIIIEYFSPVDNKGHRYFPDVFVELETKQGVVKMLVEIKPFAQTQAPKPRKKQTPQYLNEVATFITNQAKWDAAKEFCMKHGWQFRVITEKELYRA